MQTTDMFSDAAIGDPVACWRRAASGDFARFIATISKIDAGQIRLSTGGVFSQATGFGLGEDYGAAIEPWVTM